MTYLRLQALVMYCYLCLFCITGDSVMSYPYSEFRIAPDDIRANTLSFPNSNISPHSNHVTRQQIIHTGAMQSQPNVEKVRTENSEFSFNDFLRAMNGLPEEQHQNLRATNRASIKRQNYSSINSYPQQNYNSRASQPYQESASIYAPPAIEPQPTNKASPKFNLIEPVTTKMSSKMNGLMELVGALLGSSSNNLIMKGFKDVILNGIVKPLMATKGGLKILISKLTIPLISILLINAEILVTVWWLWDEESAPQPPQPPRPPYTSAPNSYDYDNFNSTFR